MIYILIGFFKLLGSEAKNARMWRGEQGGLWEEAETPRVHMYTRRHGKTLASADLFLSLGSLNALPHLESLSIVLFLMYASVFAHMCVCVAYACLVPREARRGHWIL